MAHRDDVAFAHPATASTLVGQPIAAVQRLRALVTLLDRDAEQLARRFGFNAGDMAILYILNRAEPGVTYRASDLQRSLMNTSGAITKRLDRLQASQLVERTVDKQDRRVQNVHITDKGRTLVAASRSEVAPSLRQPLSATLEMEEWGQLNDMLDRLLLFAQSFRGTTD